MHRRIHRASGLLLPLAAILFVSSSANAFQVSSQTGRTVEAPEIDPTLARGMVALLVGGVLVLTRRRATRPPVDDDRG